MIEKKPVDDGRAIEVTFVVDADRALGPVSVAGDFNDWDLDATQLRHGEGQLTASVTLPVGQRHAFRYFADGQWFNDDQADAYEPNEFGGHNCVIDLT